MISHIITLDNRKTISVELDTVDPETAEIIALEANRAYSHATFVAAVNLDTPYYNLRAAKKEWEYAKIHADERICEKAYAAYRVASWRYNLSIAVNEAEKARAKEYLHKWQVKYTSL